MLLISAAQKQANERNPSEKNPSPLNTDGAQAARVTPGSPHCSEPPRDRGEAVPRPGWKVTAAAAGCLPSLQAVASSRSAPCGLSSHHPSLRQPCWPTCPCSLPTRRHRELLKARLPVLCIRPGLCSVPQPAVLPRVGLLSAARDTPACTHTELSGAPRDGLTFSAGRVPRRPLSGHSWGTAPPPSPA